MFNDVKEYILEGETIQQAANRISKTISCSSCCAFKSESNTRCDSKVSRNTCIKNPSYWIEKLA